MTKIKQKHEQQKDAKWNEENEWADKNLADMKNLQALWNEQN